jgi:predicted metalloendopeptidase
MKTLAPALVIALAACGCGRGEAPPKASAPPAPTHTVDLAGIDRSVAPGDDFFRFANGAWLAKTEIPPDRSYEGAAAILTEEAERRTRELVEGAGKGAAPGSNEQKVSDYYAAYMDEAAIEAQGTQPLQPMMAAIAAIGDRAALTQEICGSLRSDVDPLNATNFQTDHLFGLWFSLDFDDPTRYTPYMLQGGLGMPDRDYYVDASPAMERIRAGYRSHIASMLTLAGAADAEAAARRIFALEQDIARVHSTRTESMDVLKAKNAWSREEFSQRAPGIDWAACFRAAGLGEVEKFFVWHPRAVTGIAALVGRAPLGTWRDYLTFHLVEHYAGVLPKAFGDERFAFYGTLLSGTPRQRDRWKRAVAATDAALGDAVGRLYVARYFPPGHKARLESMVATIVQAFDRRVDRLTWMNPKTKASAKAKLATLRVGVGYPETWRDYSRLEVKRGEPVMNAWRAERFDYEVNRGKLGRPVDRSEWAMTPQTVNAVNLPLQNAMNFPAAILQPPFYDPEASSAVIYGAIGATIGHEISHSFDDQGSQFDASGRLANWWTPEDFAHFKEASAKLVAQYNAYRPFPDLAVNGQLTLSENIADVAGLSASYDAFSELRKAATPAAAAGQAFTDDQQFFISYAQSWRTKFREPLLRQIITTDGHAPDEYRADTVRNLDGWYAAFMVRPGQRLHLEPADRVRVW